MENMKVLERLKSREAIKFSSKHMVSFAEVDPFGHMNSQHYLSYYNAHRFEGNQKLINLSLREISKWPIIFPISEITIKYIKPLFAGDEFEIESYISSVNDTSCEIFMEIKKNQNVISQANATYVCVDKATGTRSSWPDDTIERFFLKKEE